jgi:chloramphenicol 3-O-phosphotransferase
MINVFMRVGLDSFFFGLSPVYVRSGRSYVCGTVLLALKREALKILSMVCFFYL